MSVFFNGLFPFNHVLVPMSSPAFLLQKLFPGKCPETGPSFAYLWEARALLRVAVTLCRAPQPFSFCAAAGPPPGKKGTWVTKCPLGFSSADSSVDSSDR